MNRNERLIMRKALVASQEAGWTVDYIDDGEEVCKVTNNIEQAILLACNLDELSVHFKHGRNRGWIRFIFANGNHGLDVISDYSTNLKFMEEVMVWVDAFGQSYNPSEQWTPRVFLRMNDQDRIVFHGEQLRAALQAVLEGSGIEQARALLEATAPVQRASLKFYGEV